MSERLSDQEFGRLVHDAYEAMAPTDDVRDRVLRSLREAEAPARGGAGRRRALLVALPLAACLALAVVLVSTRGAGTFETSAAAERTMMADEAAEVEMDAAGVPEEAELVAEEAAPAAEVRRHVGETVTLVDGTTFEVGDVVDAAPAYDTLEDATADDGGEGRPCEVADRSFVRFAGESSWYALVEPQEAGK